MWTCLHNSYRIVVCQAWLQWIRPWNQQPRQKGQILWGGTLWDYPRRRNTWWIPHRTGNLSISRKNPTRNLQKGKSKSCFSCAVGLCLDMRPRDTIYNIICEVVIGGGQQFWQLTFRQAQEVEKREKQFWGKIHTGLQHHRDRYTYTM